MVWEPKTVGMCKSFVFSTEKGAHADPRYVVRSVIVLFIHTPFPSSEVFRCLPRRSQPHLSLQQEKTLS
jgi:hypothetical protein